MPYITPPPLPLPPGVPGDLEMLAGNLASVSFSFVALILVVQWPDNFDWESTCAINKPGPAPETMNKEKSDSDGNKKPVYSDDNSKDELDNMALNKAFKFTATSSVALFVILILIIPLPLFFSQHIYGGGDFTGWVAIGIAWAFLSAITVVIYPLRESQEALFKISRGTHKDLFTKESGKYVKAFSPTSAALTFCEMGLLAIGCNWNFSSLISPF